MRIWGVIRKTLPSLAKQARALLILIAAGAAILLVLQAVLAQSATKTSDLLTGDLALRTIELDSSLPNGMPTPLTAAQQDQIAADPRVQDVQAWLQVGVQVTDDRFPLAPAPVLWMTPRISAVQPPEIGADSSAGSGSVLAADDVLLPSMWEGESLQGLVGSDLSISYTVKTAPDAGESRARTVHVAGVYDETLQGLDGPSAIYAPPALVLELSALRESGNVADFETTYAYPKVFVTVSDLADVDAVRRDLTADGFAVGTLSRSDNLPGVVQFLTIVSAGISALLLIFSLGCGLSIGASLTRYRQREIGLYRALGWSRRKLSLQYSAQLGLLGLIAGVGGTLVGVGLSLVVSVLLRDATFWGLSFSSALEVPAAPWLVLTALAPTVGLLLGAVVPLVRAVRLDPDTALRDV
jgi:predicted lysophospholipase L1 biosynthesis ABC-type transport system permease subunit